MNRNVLIFIAALIVAVVGCGVVPNVILPAVTGPVVLPVIQLPGEVLIHDLFPGFDLTNTLVATLLADIVLLLFGLLAVRSIKEVPSGVQNLFEVIIEALYGMVTQVAGHKRARQIFPWFATIFLFLLIANWMELLPGVDSIGLVHQAHGDMQGYELHENWPIAAIDGSRPVVIAEEGEHEAGEHISRGYVVTPFVRAAATDLNLTLGLAITAVVLVQVFGVMELGPAYFYKFINIPGIAKGGMGYMDFGVGLLEIVSELAKVISFAFRLFGNIFAGQVLLFVMTYLVATVMPIVFYGLELFVGAVQAFVFAMLTLVFITSAMVSHHEGEAH